MQQAKAVRNARTTKTREESEWANGRLALRGGVWSPMLFLIDVDGVKETERITIKKKRSIRSRKLEMDLTGPEGNAFVLLGRAKSLAEQLGKDASAITAEMKSGDHENLVAVFDREFGSLVTLYR